MRRQGAMLGSGGRIVRPVSESDALTAAIQHITHGDPRAALDVLKQLREQVGAGYHANPMLSSSSRTYQPFRIIGPLGRDVHFIAYTHAEDGKNYKHDFKGGNAEVIAVERHGKRELLITSPTGAALWDEF